MPRPGWWTLLVAIGLMVAVWLTRWQDLSTPQGKLTLAGWVLLVGGGALVMTLLGRLRYFWCSQCHRAWSLNDVAVNGVLTAPYSCPVCSMPNGRPSAGLLAWRAARRRHPDFPPRPAPGEIYRSESPAA